MFYPKNSIKILVFLLSSSLVLGQKTRLPNPINTPQSIEYAPSVTADGQTLVYQSDQFGIYVNSAKKVPVINAEGKSEVILEEYEAKFFGVYEAKLHPSGQWLPPVHIAPINQYANENMTPVMGGPSISYDGNTLFFFANFGKNGYGREDIYISERKKSGWSKPENIGNTINTENYEGFPSIAPDGKKLYFTREVLGKKSAGKQCYSIMASEKGKNGKWRTPYELPAPINLDCEKAPRILADGKTMVFSSIKKGGRGDFDLYKSTLNLDGSWSEPINLDFINSKKSDQFVSVSPCGDLMYMVSDGDIFTTTIPESLRPIRSATIQGYVMDSITLQPLSAKIIVKEKKSNTILAVLDNNPSDGRYTAIVPFGEDYNLSVNIPDYFTNQKAINSEQIIDCKPIPQDFKLKKIPNDKEEIVKTALANSENTIPDFQKERLSSETKAKELLELERKQAEKLKAELAEKERLATETKAKELLELERKQAEKLKAELAEKERLVTETKAKELLELERKQAEKLKAELAEKERLATETKAKELLELERKQAEKLKAELAEKERLTSETKAKELLELERKQAEKLKAELEEKERLATETKAKELLELERKQAEKLKAKLAEKERLATETKAKELLEIERKQAEKLKAELAENERLATETKAKELLKLERKQAELAIKKRWAESTIEITLKETETKLNLNGKIIIFSKNTNDSTVHFVKNGLLILPLIGNDEWRIKAFADEHITIEKIIKIELPKVGIKSITLELELGKEIYLIELLAQDLETNRPILAKFQILDSQNNPLFDLDADVKGKVVQKLPKGGKYTVKMEAIGYEKDEQIIPKVKLNTKVTFKPILLKEKLHELKLLVFDRFTDEELYPSISVSKELMGKTPVFIKGKENTLFDIKLDGENLKPENYSLKFNDSLINKVSQKLLAQKLRYEFDFRIFLKNTNSPIPRLNLKIIELESKQEIQIFSNGKYIGAISPEKNYVITLNNPLYEPFSEKFNGLEWIKLKDFEKNIFLSLKPKDLVVDKPAVSVISTKTFGEIIKGKKITLESIYFDQSSPILREESYLQLDELVKILIANPSLNIEIRGHTDNVGDFYENIKLSKNRCESVINYLVSKSVSKNRLTSVGKGPIEPISPNDTEINKKKNRRVEFMAL
jgi:outer membrane protein OmpA-like peptidoglycan-associated protein